MTVDGQLRRIGETAESMRARAGLVLTQAVNSSRRSFLGPVHGYDTVEIGGMIVPERPYLVRLVSLEREYPSSGPKGQVFRLDSEYAWSHYWGEEALQLATALRRRVDPDVGVSTMR